MSALQLDTSTHKAIRFIKQYRSFDHERTPREFKNAMESFGFRRVLRRGLYSHTSGQVWVGKRFVIKRNLICGYRPRRSIQTKIIRTNDGLWLVQPRCQPLLDKFKGDWIKAQTYLDKQLNLTRHSIADDLHPGNFGIYKGKVVAYDW